MSDMVRFDEHTLNVNTDDDGTWQLSQQAKTLDLRQITGKQFGLFDGDELIRHTVFEVRIEFTAFNRQLLILADQRHKDAFGSIPDLVVTVGPFSFSVATNTLAILWREYETW